LSADGGGVDVWDLSVAEEDEEDEGDEDVVQKVKVGGCGMDRIRSRIIAGNAAQNMD
jgi:hypothetical protein